MSINRKRLSKKEREAIHAMFEGHCTYCGKIIQLDEMQVDHKIPCEKVGRTSWRTCIHPAGAVIITKLH